MVPTMRILLIFGLVVSCTLAQQVQDCPRYCSCFRVQRGVSANCNYQRLSSLKDMVFPVDTFYLDFSFNTLSEVNADALPDLPNLTILKIEECQVGSLDADSFVKVPNLQNLTLNGNQIQSIHKDAFRGLGSLRHLFLEKNNIAQLEDGLFDTLELEQLYLTENNIQQITTGTFNGLMVSDLRLGGNKISTLTSDILMPIKESLTMFTMQDNEVPLTIDIDTFAGTSLQMLKLSNSKISDHGFLKYVAAQTLDLSGNTFKNLDFSPYSGLPGLSRVETLALSNVGIKALDEKTLMPFQGITSLDLSKNEISRTNGDIWRNVPYLANLDLMENPIRRLHYSFGRYLSGLKTLVLRGCQFTELTDPDPFMGMTNLEVLDFTGNFIQIIGHQMEPILDRLRSFLVDSNRFHCNCEMLWLHDWIRNSSQAGKFVVRGFDICSSPGPGNLYIWGMPKDEFVCTKPAITHIIGSTELDHHANGNGSVMNVAPGTTIMLQCSGYGDPAPVLQWNFPFATAEEVVIEPGSNRTILKSSTHYQLKNIRLDQSGKYKCIASNIQGTTEAYIQVNVQTDLNIPSTPEPLIPTAPTATSTEKSMSTEKILTSTPTAKPTTSTQKPVDSNPSEKPTSGNQIQATSNESDDKVKFIVIGVGVSVIVITIIVLVVVIVYVYKARKRVYQRTYDVQNKVGDAKYPGVEGMTNGDGMHNGHTPLERLDSEISTKSTTPFGLSHA